jgi:hypothetical protein
MLVTDGGSKMSFQIYLFTSPDTKAKFWGVEFTGRGRDGEIEFGGKIEFPPAGSSSASQMIVKSESFDLDLRFGGTGDKPFRATRLGADDTLALVYLPNQTILGNIAHAKPQVQCEVHCPDGRTAQGCIICKIDGHIVKICC